MNLADIFEKFTREHTSTESKVMGTGLGFPIVKYLVIAITILEEYGLKVEWAETGMNGFIAKTIDAKLVFATIGDILLKKSEN